MNLEKNQFGDWDNLASFNGQALLINGESEGSGLNLVLFIQIQFVRLPPYSVIIAEINRPWGEVEEINRPWGDIIKIDKPWGEIEPVTED